MGKINLALVFGGKSAEHEISLRSAQNVIQAIDKDKYDLTFIAIAKDGSWYTQPGLKAEEIQQPLSMSQFTVPVAIGFDGKHSLFLPTRSNDALVIDVFFPILHGPNGEDGRIQGLFRSLQLPFVGCDVLGSAIGMDKEVMKRLFEHAGIPIGKYMAATRDSYPTFEEVVLKLDKPFYIKPANMGSSVGISKVTKEDEYSDALEEAFNYDRKIVIEENIIGAEIECAVLGNEQPKASVLGRIKAFHEFYTYTSKYLDDDGFELEIPAKIPKKSEKAIREIAIKVFQVLEAEGLGRVDVFLKEDGTILVNEINTIPGFTSISMYPMLWKESGLSYQDLIDELIKLAFKRAERERNLKSSFKD